MDLSDFNFEPTSSQAAQAHHSPEPLDLQALVAQLGSEVAGQLSSALERVSALTATGRIDKHGLRELRREIDLARRAGIMGQQITRLGSGRVQLAHESVDLTALLREALRQRGREIGARGIEVRQTLGTAAVSSDATLLFSLLETALDWTFEHAVSRIDIGLAVKHWPARAYLSVRFLHRPADEVGTAPGSPAPGEEPRLNTMAWRLVQQTALVLGLGVQREDTPGKTALCLEFPQTLADRLPDAASTAGPDEHDDADAQAHNSQPLAGRHVVVLAARREVRNVVREALRAMGLMLDFVSSVEEAQHLCAGGLPHAMVYEASLGGDRFERLRNEMLAEVPGLAFIQIAEQGRAFEVLNVAGRQFASVGRDAIIESLPAALLFELSRQT